ncbi:hypothetical protein NQ317_001495 [Molorchus minor]|uniref:Uncharacterized protein n=1 Tax=Molorchus minor TaxID=1323400 RepID=A0ABQ9IR83_9CUCU|nr:hypothetical protein NQ317_001495 [Molorchus minor]
MTVSKIFVILGQTRPSKNHIDVIKNRFLFLSITPYIVICCSDGWGDRGDVTKGYEEEAWGGLSIRIHSPYVNSFDDYYWSLKPANNTRNPWFKEFWESRFSCYFEGDATELPPFENYTFNYLQTESTSVDNTMSTITPQSICTGEESLATNYRQDSKLSFVIKAIYSLAHALHDMHQDICGFGAVGMCDKQLPFNGSLFKNYLMNVSFEYDKEIIEFDENGDPLRKVRHHELSETRRWGHLTTFRCPQGQYKNVQQGGKDKRCCWVCVPCPAGEILEDDGEGCIKCPLGAAPNDQKTGKMIRSRNRFPQPLSLFIYTNQTC